MRLCPGCERHVFGHEPGCPFCGVKLRSGAASVVGAVVLCAGITMSACVVRDAPEDQDGTEGSTTGPTDDPTAPPLPPTITDSGTVTASTTTTATTDPTDASVTVTATADTGDSGWDDGCGGFYGGCPTDWGGVPHCDPGLQDCPNPDEKCTSYVTEPGYCCVDANKCVPIIGDREFGEPCTRTADNDDCAKGLFCMTTTSGGTGDGICRDFCVPNTPDACQAHGGECLPFNDGIMPLCETKCDPLVQDCGTGEGCVPISPDGFGCVRPVAGAGADGQACYLTHSCEPGTTCRSATDTTDCTDPACCTPLCDLREDPALECTEPGETCVAWFEIGMAPPDYEFVGFCGLPP